MIFVHGGAGSGAQFETQALRLTSNGYPADRIAVHEYDSTFGLNTMADVWAGLDALIAELLAETGADRDDLLGHSLGTAVSHGYLNSSPERAAGVAHYVNIDGQSSATEPGGVDTLAVWGEGSPTRQIGGAENWYAPDQAHVQVATSAETFAQFYEHFTGRPPRTTRVVPEHGRIRLAGRASLFPANVGAENTTLRVWAVDGRTGQRRSPRPLATYDIGPDGHWGPFRGHAGKHYEMTLTNATTGSQHHFYFQPFVRSDHLVRLLTGEPGTGIDLLREKGPHHSSVAVTRYKEWWGDQGAGSDVLAIDGQPILNAANAPRTKRVNALFAFDAGSDRVTDLAAPLPAFFALPFITGMDVYVPATDPPDDRVRITSRSRTAPGTTVTVNVPNWPSTDHHVSVQLWDFDQPRRRPG